MATGDQSDMLTRLQRLLPTGWFGDDNPIRDAMLTACAEALAWAYSLYIYAKAQTRIKTASDNWLDLIALDFFGTNLVRYSNQTDSSYLNRILINIFRERTTRAGMRQVLLDLTGREPLIIEPACPQDVGCLGQTMYLGTAPLGSISTPYQAFVTAYRPTGNGAGNWPGINTTAFGLATTSGLVPDSQLFPDVSDADIVAAIEATKPYGTTIWYRISS